MKFLGGAPKVHDLVGLAPTSHGSTALGRDKGIRALFRVFPGRTRSPGRATPPSRPSTTRWSPRTGRNSSTGPLREVLNALDPGTARGPDCSTPVLPVLGG